MVDHDTYGPEHDLPDIRAYFLVTVLPEGESPEDIRKQWVGLSLPLRHDISPESPRPVLTAEVITGKLGSFDDAVDVWIDDCVDALMFAQRTEAAEYWRRMKDTAHLGWLVFNAGWGLVLSPEAKERFYPDL